MSKSKIILFCITVGILIILSQLFLERSYDISPMPERQNTQYWELETGSKIAYFQIKSPVLTKKNPIIYLHGGPGGRITDKIIKAFSPFSELGHDLYFYDQIGSGQSTRLENIEEYSVDRHRRDLEEIITKIGFEQVILVGHSWGALLAINYLEDNNKRVEKLILTGPGPILPINNRLSKQRAPDSLSLILPEYSNKEGNTKANNLRSKFIQKWAYLFNEKLADDKEADEFFAYLNQELIKSTDCQWNRDKKYEAGCGYYSHIMTVKSFNEIENRREILKTINTPILILRGQCDNQKWGFTKEYLDLFSNSKLEIIENAGHDLIGGDIELHNEMIEAFLEEE